jgi:PhnB protein
MAVKPIPEAYHSVTPYLVVRGAEKVVEFLKAAFGADVVFEPLKRPDGDILHVEVKIGSSRVMLSERSEEHEPMLSMLYLYVPDVDATYRQAIAASGTTLKEPHDEFFGDRTASVKDPSGNTWEIATRKEDCRGRNWKSAPRRCSRRRRRRRERQAGCRESVSAASKWPQSQRR